METRHITIYVICEDLLKIIGIKDDPQSRMTYAEIMAFSIIASQLTNGNHKKARWICKRLGYFPNILSVSRLNRKLRKLPLIVWNLVFRILSKIFIGQNGHNEYAVDSFPVACCQKSRNDRRRLFVDASYLGWAPSKQQYFCGVKVHMIVTGTGQPVELAVLPASKNDVSALWNMSVDLPAGSLLFADGAYDSYNLEDLLQTDQAITLLAKRGHPKSTRARPREHERFISSRRQIVETTFNSITSLLPRALRLRTEKGFMIRIYSAILAFSMSFLQ